MAKAEAAFMLWQRSSNEDYPMFRGFLVALFFAVAVNGCYGQDQNFEASASFKDKVYKDYSIAALEKAGIPYGIDGHQIWYPAEKSDEVRAILQEVAKTMPTPFEIYDSSVRSRFIDSLDGAGIEYTLIPETDEHRIYVRRDQYERAAKIFRKIMKGKKS